MDNSLYLAGDVGGTNARFALVSLGVDGKAQPNEVHTYATHDGVLPAVAQFLKEVGNPALVRAVFGMAGPVVKGSCYMPNAGWTVSEAEFKAQFDFPLRLYNDMVANAAGINQLASSDFKTLHAGQIQDGHRALIAPGTGLGKALLAWDGTRHHVVAGEGGHTDFAPRNPEEDALLVYLRTKFGRVSAERVACGRALPNIYDFLKDTGRAKEPTWLKAELAQANDPGPVLFEAAFEKEESIAKETFRLFATLLGSEAGNLCLTGMALGGCYLGGGVLPRMADWLVESGYFMQAFLDKDPHRAVLEQMPVRLIANPQTALIGAAGLVVG